MTQAVRLTGENRHGYLEGDSPDAAAEVEGQMNSYERYQGYAGDEDDARVEAVTPRSARHRR